jgi:hypothetical protein
MISRIRLRKLFIETEFDAPSAGLRKTSRRPRQPGETTPCVFVLGVEGRQAVPSMGDRPRAALGRNRSPQQAIALDGRPLSGVTGAVLDPIASLRDRVRLAPGAVVQVTFHGWPPIEPRRSRSHANARWQRLFPRVLMAFTHSAHNLWHSAERRTCCSIAWRRGSWSRCVVHEPPDIAEYARQAHLGATASRATRRSRSSAFHSGSCRWCVRC